MASEHRPDARADADSTDNASEPTETVCPLCAVGCRLVRGTGERARGRAGPANPDGHLCAKGANAFESVADTDRLTTPLVRDADGDLVATDWATALDRAANGLGAVRDDHGGSALAFLGAPHCSNEENYLLGKLARLCGSNTVDNRARLCHDGAAEALASRAGYPASTLGLDGLREADLVLVVGANPAVQQPVAFDAFVRASDATVVHVDPRANETTRAADVHLAPRPGGDAALVQSVCAALVERDAIDESFVAARTTGYEAYADALDGVDVPGAAATGVPAEEIRGLADAVADADSVAVVAGTGVEAGGTTTSDALLDLLCLTGNLGRDDAGFALFRGLNNEQGATDVGCRPDELPGHESVTDPAARERVASVWGSDPPEEPGLNETEALGAFGESIRGALVVGENPAVAKRDAAWTNERLDALDSLVVVDVYETDTTEHADVVLPAAVGVEKAGTVTNLDRRIQALVAAADPPGDARPDFEILCELGSRLVGDGFDYDVPADALAELRDVSPLHADVSVGERWGGDDLYADSFATPDGRAAFGAVDLDLTAPPENELAFVVGSRAGGFGASDRRADGVLHLNPADADERGLADGDAVAVSAGLDADAAAVETTLRVDSGVRPGVAYIHADAADPLVRAGASTVRVESA